MRSVSSMPAAGNGSGGLATVSEVGVRHARPLAARREESPARRRPAGHNGSTWISQSRFSRRAATISAQAARLRMRWKRAAGTSQRLQSPPDDRRFLESLLTDQPCNRAWTLSTAGRASMDKAARTASTISW